MEMFQAELNKQSEPEKKITKEELIASIIEKRKKNEGLDPREIEFEAQQRKENRNDDNPHYGH